MIFSVLCYVLKSSTVNLQLSLFTKHFLNWFFFPLSPFQNKHIVKQIHAASLYKERFRAKCININCIMQIKLFIWINMRGKYIICKHAKTLCFSQEFRKKLLSQLLNVPSCNTKVCMNFSSNQKKYVRKLGTREYSGTN